MDAFCSAQTFHYLSSESGFAQGCHQPKLCAGLIWKEFNQNAQSNIAIVAFYGCFEEQKGQFGFQVPVGKA